MDLKMNIEREDKVTLKIKTFQDGIIRIQAGGIDGFQDSLLNRYNFIESLETLDTASWEDHKLSLPDSHSLIVNPDLSFALLNGDDLLFETVSGYCPGTGSTCFQNKGYAFCSTIDDEEKLIGFGDQYRQGFLLNGQRESLWIRNQSDYIPVPFFMSSKGYGILFNTTRRLYYDFGVTESDKSIINVATEYMDIYIFTGSDYWDIIRKYTLLTGRPQIPPMYTFGLWMVAHSEIRAHELLQLAVEMRKDKIPCDILALEPLWMEKAYDDSLEKKWNEERFPHAPWAQKDDTFIGNLKLMGYHFGLWMLSDYDHTWDEERRINGKLPDIYAASDDMTIPEQLQLVEEDDHFGHVPMRMDKITKPEEPYFEHLKKFVDEGVDYFKQDGYALINLHPDRLYGNQCHDDVMHNIHYMIYTRQMLRGMEEHTGRRAFTMAVAGWAGFQKFSGTWTGDTGGGDQSLCGILQLATVGHAFATCDMEVNTVPGIHMGLLLPWAQLCSWAYYKYPVYKGEEIKTVFRNYINLRMQLLLLYYSLAREAELSGKSIARPLHLVYPEIDVAYALRKEFMLGDAFLVGVYSNEVVLPKGQWFDYWTNRVVSGDWSNVELTSDNKLYGGALFVKPGAIIPLIPVQQYVSERELKQLTFQIFPAAGRSEFNLYLDDGVSLKHRDGKYAEATLYCDSATNKVEVYWGDISGDEPERISSLNYSIELLGMVDVTAVDVDGVDTSFMIDELANRTFIPAVKFGSKVVIYSQD
jgi:alpha-glucosidase (family GH31 glycosyl hydrolase)